MHQAQFPTQPPDGIHWHTHTHSSTSTTPIHQPSSPGPSLPVVSHSAPLRRCSSPELRRVRRHALQELEHGGPRVGRHAGAHRARQRLDSKVAISAVFAARDCGWRSAEAPPNGRTRRYYIMYSVQSEDDRATRLDLLQILKAKRPSLAVLALKCPFNKNQMN